MVFFILFIIFFVIVFLFVFEFFSWCFISGKMSCVMMIMYKIVLLNGKYFLDGVFFVFDEEVSDMLDKIESNYKMVFESKEVVIGFFMDVFCLLFMWICLFLVVVINFLCFVVYYGLSLNVVNLNMNFYFNVFFNVVVEMFVFLLIVFLLDKFGSKLLVIGILWFSGFFCIIGSLLKYYYGLWNVVWMMCGVLGMFGMVGMYNLLFIYTVEFFSIVVSNVVLGCVI